MNTCAVCPKPIGPAWLMCEPHWARVSNETQDRAMRAWGRLNRAQLDTVEWQQAVMAYGEAVKAALAEAEREEFQPEKA